VLSSADRRRILDAGSGEARAVVEHYITAINAGDGPGVQDALSTQADGWNRSEIDRMEVIYTQADKVDLLLWFVACARTAR
jgi:hypothetical protein